MLRVIPTAVALCLLSSGPALAASAYDGIYSGGVTCEASGSSAGFTSGVVYVIHDGRFRIERGAPGTDGWEWQEGTVSPTGDLDIKGAYVAETEKPIAFHARIADGRLTGDGRRGPRRCTLDFAKPPSAGVVPPYHGVPDPAARRQAMGVPGNVAPCKPAPAPVRDLIVAPFYEKGDPTHSRIDPAADALYREQLKPLRAFVSDTIKMGDAYLGTQPRTPASAECAISRMESWASAHALLGHLSPQGAYERKWTLSSLGMVYMALSDAPDIAPKQRATVESWFGDLARAVLPPYSGASTGARNNHLNWAALAVLEAAVITNDQALFDWAVDRLKVAVDQIDADGSLPLELARASRALHYHVFALQPLVTAAEILAANGIDMYGWQGGALHRLVAFTRASLANPAALEARLGVKQDVSDPVPPSLYSWAEAYAARFGDPETLTVLARVRGRGLSDGFAGGSQTLRFGLSTLPH